MICHIVLFTPRDDLPPERMRSFARTVLEACGSIPVVARAVVGKAINVDPGYSRSMGDSTYSFAAVLEFNDRAALIEYLQHPLHAALGREFWDIARSTVVVEVEGREASEWRVDELV